LFLNPKSVPRHPAPTKRRLDLKLLGNLILICRPPYILIWCITMKPINQHIHGKLFIENGRAALLLLNRQPETQNEHSLYLRFAFVLQGSETLLFPASVLDDWGGEIRSQAIYQWVRDFGDQFPRAEIFGFDADGRQAQRFVRELELTSHLAVMAFRNKGAEMRDGVSVEAILLPDVQTQEPVQIRRPSRWKRPLSAANLSWWHVNPGLTAWHFPAP